MAMMLQISGGVATLEKKTPSSLRAGFGLLGLISESMVAFLRVFGVQLLVPMETPHGCRLVGRCCEIEVERVRESSTPLWTGLQVKEEFLYTAFHTN